MNNNFLGAMGQGQAQRPPMLQAPQFNNPPSSQDNLSPDEKQGLIYGALISAGIGAASGKDTKDSVLKAVINATGSYTGGMKNLYDQKVSDFKIAHAVDMDRASKKYQIDKLNWDMQQEANARERQELLDYINMGKYQADKDRQAKSDTAIDRMIKDKGYPGYLGDIIKGGKGSKAVSDIMNLKKKEKKQLTESDVRRAKEVFPMSYSLKGEEEPYPTSIRDAMVVDLALAIKENPEVLSNKILRQEEIQRIHDEYIQPDEDDYERGGKKGSVLGSAIGSLFSSNKGQGSSVGAEISKAKETSVKTKRLLTPDELAKLGIANKYKNKKIYQLPNGKYEIE